MKGGMIWAKVELYRQHDNHGETDTEEELSHEPRGAGRRQFPSVYCHHSQPAGHVLWTSRIMIPYTRLA